MARKRCKVNVLTQGKRDVDEFDFFEHDRCRGDEFAEDDADRHGEEDPHRE